MHWFIFLPAMIPVIFADLASRNPMENEGLFEGDILIPNWDGDRNAVPLDVQRWVDGKVPFVISDKGGRYEDEFVKKIHTAMELIMSKTCIRFVPRQKERDYVRIFKGSGCSSYRGRVGGVQELSLSNGCAFVNVVMHELLHAIGFAHEHSRPDRDDYITINWSNIKEEWYYAFVKLRPNETRILTPFDYNSIMLYDSYSFTKIKKFGIYGMTDKQAKPLRGMNDKPGMSESDIRRINILYECGIKL